MRRSLIARVIRKTRVRLWIRARKERSVGVGRGWLARGGLERRAALVGVVRDLGSLLLRAGRAEPELRLEPRTQLQDAIAEAGEFQDDRDLLGRRRLEEVGDVELPADLLAVDLLQAGYERADLPRDRAGIDPDEQQVRVVAARRGADRDGVLVEDVLLHEPFHHDIVEERLCVDSRDRSAENADHLASGFHGGFPLVQLTCTCMSARMLATAARATRSSRSPMSSLCWTNTISSGVACRRKVFMLNWPRTMPS